MNFDLFGNPIDTPEPARPAQPEREDLTAHADAWKADKMFTRGEHPASGLRPLTTGAAVCGGCRFYISGPQPDRGTCRQAGAPCRGSWTGCALFDLRPALDPNTAGRTGVLHPQTSQRSGRRVKAGSQQAGLLVAMAGRRVGLTAKEGADVIDRSVNQVGARLGELREAGFARYVQPGDGVPSERDGALVHLVTDAGRIEANNLRS